MKKLLTLCLFAGCLPVLAQNDYTKKQFITAMGDTVPYRELSPKESIHKKKFPLVLFLHGAGERGNDNEKQLTHGANMFENPVVRDKYPAYVLFPQCPTEGYWVKASQDSMRSPSALLPYSPYTPIDDVKQLIDYYLTHFPIDTDRVYVIGLSMGGMGTFEITSKYPALFAAAVPICGQMENPKDLIHTKGIPFRIFHGDADQVVPIDGSRDAYNTLTDLGYEVEYIEYPGVKHGSWHNAFNEKDFISWIFKQKK